MGYEPVDIHDEGSVSTYGTEFLRAWIAAKNEMGAVIKAGVNQFKGGAKYAVLADVIAAVMPSALKNGLMHAFTFRVNDGTIWAALRLIHAETGQFMEYMMPCTPVNVVVFDDHDTNRKQSEKSKKDSYVLVDQAKSSALMQSTGTMATYAMRYLLCVAWWLELKKDTDGEPDGTASASRTGIDENKRQAFSGETRPTKDASDPLAEKIAASDKGVHELIDGIAELFCKRKAEKKITDKQHRYLRVMIGQVKWVVPLDQQLKIRNSDIHLTELPATMMNGVLTLLKKFAESADTCAPETEGIF